MSTSTKEGPTITNAGFKSYGYSNFECDVEDADRYRPGGFHPVIIGDALGPEGRYTVFHKLGFGGYGTVWFCRDTVLEKWKAIKLLAASESGPDNNDLKVMRMFNGVSRDELEHHRVCLPDSHFYEVGPNGKHLCLVLPVLAEPIIEAWSEFGGDEPDMLKQLCAQMCEAMQFLHKHDICHGDFRSRLAFPSNTPLRTCFCQIRQNCTPFDDDLVYGYVQSLEDILGPLPEPYRSAWFENGHASQHAAGRGLPLRDMQAAGDLVSMTPDQAERLKTERYEEHGYRDFLDMLLYTPTQFAWIPSHGNDLIWNEWQTSAEEAKLLLDLVQKVFTYDPAERLSVKQIMDHQWFEGVFKHGLEESQSPERSVEGSEKENADDGMDDSHGAKEDASVPPC